MTAKSTAVQAVIFDCDGVVMERNRSAFGPLSDALALQGITPDRSDLRGLLRGGNPGSFVKKVIGLGADLPENWLVAEYDSILQQLADGARPVAGIVDVLTILDSAGIRYAMASNGPLVKMEVMLAQHDGMADRFGGHLYSARSLHTQKPAPRIFLHAARRLGVPPRRCAVVDDGILGVTAAIAAGMRGFYFAAEDRDGLGDEGAALSDYAITPFRAMTELPALLGL